MQAKFQINHLLEERIKLLKTQIVSGCNATRAEPFKCKSRRRQNQYNFGTFKHLPVFQTKIGLPTIKEMSPEKPCNKSNSQLIDAINQSKFITLQKLLTETISRFNRLLLVYIFSISDTFC